MVQDRHREYVTEVGWGSEGTGKLLEVEVTELNPHSVSFASQKLLHDWPARCWLHTDRNFLRKCESPLSCGGNPGGCYLRGKCFSCTLCPPLFLLQNMFKFIPYCPYIEWGDMLEPSVSRPPPHLQYSSSLLHMHSLSCSETQQFVFTFPPQPRIHSGQVSILLEPAGNEWSEGHLIRPLAGTSSKAPETDPSTCWAHRYHVGHRGAVGQ